MTRYRTVLLLCLAVAAAALPAGTALAAGAKNVVVAQVGGERIYLSALNRAAAPYKYQLEKQGYEFASDQGRSLYQQLQTNVLNEMIVRALLNKGASAKGVSVSTKELEQGYRRELGQRKQTEREFLAELAAYGWTKAIFLADLRQKLTEDKFIDRYIAKGKSGDARDAAVNDWLAKKASGTKIQVYFQANAGGGDALKQAEKAALDYYLKHGGARDVKAQATNYGCHIQVDIIKDGKVIKSYGYSNGQVYEI